MYFTLLRRRWGCGSSGSTSSGGGEPLAFGQYGELGPGLEELLDTIAEAGASEAAERYLINRHLAAKSVHLRLVRQRVVMAVQKAQADVRINRLHYALPG
jgi:hypothetical protein